MVEKGIITENKKKPFVRNKRYNLWEQPELTEEQRENLRAHIESELKRFKQMREMRRDNEIKLNLGTKKSSKDKKQ